MKLVRIFLVAFTLAGMLFVVSSCSKDDDNDGFDLSSGNLTGWWINLPNDSSHMAWAWHFYGSTSEGEYDLWDSKDSGHSKNAFGKWYMNNIICVDWPYHVEGTKVYINTTHRLNILDGKLVDVSSGRVYTRQ